MRGQHKARAAQRELITAFLLSMKARLYHLQIFQTGSSWLERLK
jgi:hypothetical protein